MKKFFQFNDTISGKIFLLRSLFTIVMTIPLIIIIFSWWTTVFFDEMGISISEASSIDQSSANKFGEELGQKISKDPIKYFKDALSNTSILWYVSFLLFLIPLIWFGLATYYKRISSIFHSNRIKMFFLLVIVEITLDIFALYFGGISFWICYFISLIIFLFLVIYNSPIGEHNG